MLLGHHNLNNMCIKWDFRGIDAYNICKGVIVYSNFVVYK